jgi:hypothetical protein
MKARSIRSIVSGERIVTIRTEEFSSEEIRWIAEQGEPEVALGGTFTIAAEDEFDLPETYAKVMTGMKAPGISRKFSSPTHADPSAAAIAWQEEVVSRILAAMVSLEESDIAGFTGESVDQPTYS